MESWIVSFFAYVLWKTTYATLKFLTRLMTSAFVVLNQRPPYAIRTQTSGHFATTFSNLDYNFSTYAEIYRIHAEPISVLFLFAHASFKMIYSFTRNIPYSKSECIFQHTQKLESVIYRYFVLPTTRHKWHQPVGHFGSEGSDCEILFFYFHNTLRSGCTYEEGFWNPRKKTIPQTLRPYTRSARTETQISNFYPL